VWIYYKPPEERFTSIFRVEEITGVKKSYIFYAVQMSEIKKGFPYGRTRSCGRGVTQWCPSFNPILRARTLFMLWALTASADTDSGKHGPHGHSEGILSYVCHKWPSLWSSGQSSWLQIQRSGFDSWCCQIIWDVVGLERGPLSFVSTIEELLEKKSSGSGLEYQDYNRRDTLRWLRDTPSIGKSWH
jgi:hypothetical protein